MNKWRQKPLSGFHTVKTVPEGRWWLAHSKRTWSCLWTARITSNHHVLHAIYPVSFLEVMSLRITLWTHMESQQGLVLRAPCTWLENWVSRTTCLLNESSRPASTFPDTLKSTIAIKYTWFYLRKSNKVFSLLANSSAGKNNSHRNVCVFFAGYKISPT